MSSGAPITEGDLRRTPFAHLLVYALEKQLTGEVVFADPIGLTHAIRFEGGALAKVRLGDDSERLGEMLVQEGTITDEELTAALDAGGLLGERLIQFRRLGPEGLARTLEARIRRRTLRLFALPPETTFVYVEGDGELAAWGGSEPVIVDPLSLLWDGIRAHGECSTRFIGTVAQIARAPLRMHPRAQLERLGLEGDDLVTARSIAEQPAVYSEIVDSGLLGAPALRKLIYVLGITRQLDLGGDALPVGVDDPNVDRMRSRANSVARVRLVTASFRVGVAAPDLPGDGERAPVSPSARRRKRSLSGSVEISDEPVSSDSPSSPQPASVPSSGGAVPSSGGAVPSSDVVPLGTGTSRAPSGMHAAAISSSAIPAISIKTTGSMRVYRSEARTQGIELYALAETRLEARDLAGAAEACEQACQADPKNIGYSALLTWIRASLPAADVKGLAIDLDRLVAENDKHPQVRYYRALLRHRLGDSPGALRDLRRALDIDPGFSAAARDLAAMEERLPKTQKSFFGRLFKP